MSAAKANNGFIIDVGHIFDGVFDDATTEAVHASNMKYMEALFEATKTVEEPEVRDAYFDRMEKAAQEERVYMAQASQNDKLFKGALAGGAMVLAGFCFNAWVNRPQG